MAGVCVALADKLETLVGMFGIGQIPTGDKDPFALRRHALGVVRMLIEKALPLSMAELVKTAFAGFPNGLLADAHADVQTFVFERLGGTMREQGYSANEVEAVLSLNPQQIYLVPQQLEAVRAFAALPEAAALAAANKRVGNILKKVEGDLADLFKAAVALHDTGKSNTAFQDLLKQELLKEPAEFALNSALMTLVPVSENAFKAGDYTGSLKSLAALREPVDAFFDSVMVNAEDEKLRANRLALLAQLHAAMNRVADLSKLAA
jgi:glycyl-tRNA synthetase beta chain